MFLKRSHFLQIVRWSDWKRSSPRPTRLRSRGRMDTANGRGGSRECLDGIDGKLDYSLIGQMNREYDLLVALAEGNRI